MAVQLCGFSAGFATVSQPRKDIQELRPGYGGGFAGLDASPYSGLNRYDTASLNANVDVIHVTNLDPTGTGSFHDAWEASGRRFVVFDVCGEINPPVASTVMTTDYGHVAGQTACGLGVLIRKSQLEIQASNVFVEHLKIRHIPESGGYANDGDEGTILILGHTGAAHDIVISHTDNFFADDDNFANFGGTYRLDIFDNMMGWGVECEEQPTIFGCSLGGDDRPARGPLFSGDEDDAYQDLAFQRNLVTTNKVRCPTFTAPQSGTTGEAGFDGLGPRVIFANNGIYNCAGISALGQPMTHWQNAELKGILQNNYFGRGARTGLGVDARYFYFNSNMKGSPEVYLTGNEIEAGNTEPIAIFDTPSDEAFSNPFTPPTLYAPYDGDQVVTNVSDYSGAFPNRRDPVNMVTAYEFESDTGRGALDSEDHFDDIGGLYPELPTMTGETFTGCDDNPHIIVATGRTKCEEALWQAWREVTDIKAQVSLSGEMVNATEAEISQSGGIGKLHFVINHDTWVSSFNSTRQQEIILACDAASSPTNGWNNVVQANAETGDVTRVNDHHVYWQIDQETTYSIDSDETLTCTFPSTLFDSGNSNDAVMTITISAS
jgi:hypothetical protein